MVILMIYCLLLQVLVMMMTSLLLLHLHLPKSKTDLILHLLLHFLPNKIALTLLLLSFLASGQLLMASNMIALPLSGAHLMFALEAIHFHLSSVLLFKLTVQLLLNGKG